MLIWQQAKQDAEDVRAAYWSDGFPVDPEHVARKMGVEVDRRPFAADISGMLTVDPELPPEIYVDSSDIWQRQQFTIAHEIGHYYERVSRGDLRFNFIDRRGGPYDAHEFYADEFAGNLLMPEDEVLERRSKGWGLARMAQHFDVSLPAMQLRLRRIDARR